MHIVFKTGINVTHLASRLGIIICAFCIPLSGMDEWLSGEQLASLRPFLAASAYLALVWFGLHKRARWAVFATLCAALHLAGMAAPVDAPDASAQSEGCFRTLVVNAYGANPDQKRFADLSEQTRSDIVIVSELGRPLDQRLRGIYPNASSVDLDHVFGIGIYSKFPIVDSRVLRRGIEDNPVLRVTLNTPNGLVQVVAVHPRPPGNTLAMGERNALIQELAVWASESDIPFIIAGDFNTTTWSRHMLPLHRVSKRAPTGGTWPTWSWIKIPIDHIFFSGLKLKASAEMIEEFGSDHVPILAELCAPN